MSSRGSNPKHDFDSPWKNIMETFLPDLLKLLFPSIYELIDWSRGYESLDKDLQKIFPQSATSNRCADKLFKAYLKEGSELHIYLHCEVQGQRKKDFEERVFIYNYRMYDRYRSPVISLPILIDNDPSWKPEGFGYSLGGFRMEIKFPVAKLLEWKDKWEVLERSDNPVSLCIMAHLKALETANKAQLRKRWKFNLLRLLFQRGYSRKEIKELFLFIDWVLTLPEELEEELWEEVNQLEEVKAMPYISSLERIAEKRGIQIGKQEGIQIGKQEGIRKSIIDALYLKNKTVPDFIRERIKSIYDQETLESLFRAAILKQSLSEFQEELERLSSQ
jgi:hypothetical protein